MHPSVLAAAIVLLLLSVGRAGYSAIPRFVTVEAGPYDRTNTLVSFPFEPPPPGGGRWHLTAPEGNPLPVQVERGTAWAIEPGLTRGTSRRYQLQPATPPPPTTLRTSLDPVGTHLTLKLDGQPAATFIAGPGLLPRPEIRPEFLRGGYLHPLVTPAGRVVTDDYPANHIHHHGLWAAWTRTRFEGRAPDFWNMGDRKGRVDFETLGATTSGPVFAGFQSGLVYTDLLVSPPRVALRETWNVRLLAIGGGSTGFHVLDLDSAQSCAGPSPLELPRYYYGGLGYRGPMAWNGPAAALYLDSNGITNRVAANETRVRWHWLGGLVQGTVAGVASLGHPDNFRAPQPVRVHPTEPFTCWAPSQLGDWSIQPGDVHRARHRIVVLDGTPDPAVLNRLWNDFAHPPATRLE